MHRGIVGQGGDAILVDVLSSSLQAAVEVVHTLVVDLFESVLNVNVHIGKVLVAKFQTPAASAVGAAVQSVSESVSEFATESTESTAAAKAEAEGVVAGAGTAIVQGRDVAGVGTGRAVQVVGVAGVLLGGWLGVSRVSGCCSQAGGGCRGSLGAGARGAASVGG